MKLEKVYKVQYNTKENFLNTLFFYEIN